MSDDRIFNVPDEKHHIALRWGVAPNKKASEAEGRPVFDKVLHGRVIAPMQSKSEFACILMYETADGKRKYQEPYWTKYKAQAEQFMASEAGGDLQGTPIDQWAQIDQPMAATLKALQIYTVEILAQQEGTGIQRIGMGGQSLVQKARNWLEQAKDGAAMSRITAEVEKKDAQISDLQRQLQELAARMDKDDKVDGRTREGRALRAG